MTHYLLKQIREHWEIYIVISAAAAIVAGLIVAISIPVRHDWYLIGEKAGITINDNNYNYNVCHPAMIQGWIYNGSIGNDQIGLTTPPLDNHKAVNAWMKGCDHGYNISRGMNSGGY